MANQVAEINYIPIAGIAGINGVPANKIAEFNSIPFITDYRIFIIGGSAAKPKISINDGATFVDISTGTLATPRSASQSTAIFKDAFTGAPPNNRKQFVVVGYSGTTSHVSRSFDGGQTWDVSMYSGRTYDFTSICRDASYVYAGEWTYNYYLRSTDWGKTFTQSSMPANFALNFAQSNNGQYVYAGTTSGTTQIQKSSNYGVTFALSGTTTGQHKLVSCDGSGQYVFAYYLGALGIYFSTNYGTNFTRLNAGSSGGQAGNFRDGTLHFYTVCTSGDASNGLVYSTNGSTWTRVAFPAGWTTASLSYSQEFKRIYIYRAGYSYLYKLNDAKNGWDLIWSTGNAILGHVSASEFRDEVFVCEDSTYNFYIITPSGTRTGPIYTGSASLAVPSLF